LKQQDAADQDQELAQEVDAAQNALQDLNINADLAQPGAILAEAGAVVTDEAPLPAGPARRARARPAQPAGPQLNRQRRPVLGGQGVARFREGQNWGDGWGGGREGEHIRGRRVIAREVEAELVDMDGGDDDGMFDTFDDDFEEE